MSANSEKISGSKTSRPARMRGFSLIEIIIVLLIIGVMSVISLPYIFNYTKLYKPEDQALKLMDFMREANQLALTKRRTMRFEIDITDNQALIIDTRSAGNADDIQIKTLALEKQSDVRVDQIPTGATKPNPPNYTDAAFVTDSTGHLVRTTTVNGHQVLQMKFLSDGSVVNMTNNPVSLNLYLWTPLTPGNAAPKNIKEVRAVTIFSGSGAVKYWRHNGTNFIPF